MKILFNKNFAGNIILPLLIITAFVFIGFLILKKTQRMEKENIFSKELTIDTVSDSRSLGYAGQRKIIRDNQGNTYVGYRKDYEKNAEIFVAKISQDSNDLHISDTEKPVATIGKNNDQRVPSLAIDSKDTLHVVWYGSDTENVKNNRQIKYVRKEAGAKKWESWRNIAFVSGYDEDEYWQEHPVILAGKSNTLYIAWEGKDEKNKKQQIKFSKSENGGTVWSSWKNIAPTKNNTQSRPTLIEDTAGKLFLFMYSSQGSENDLQQIQYATSSDKGESWTPWKLISNPDFDSRHISVTTDPTGKIHLTWRAQTKKDGPSQIIYRLLSEEKWSDDIIVSSSQNYQFFPSIGTDQSGLVYVVWMENQDSSEFPRENPLGGTGLISFLRKGKFQAPIKLSEKANTLYPHVAEKIELEAFVPVFYATQLNEKAFNLKLKFIDSNK